MLESQSILLVTENPETDLQNHFEIDIRQADVDTLMITAETSVGIDDIRFIKEFCRTPPFRHQIKTVIIPDAGTMTHEAQNALLKTLEEPAEYVRIILVCRDSHPFLETVLSRCRIVYGSKNSAGPNENPGNELERLCMLLPPARTGALPAIKSKQQVSEYCSMLVYEASAALSHQPDTTTLYNLKLLNRCLESLSKNANPTIAITDTVLRLK